jgi:Fe(3+) dicitrate transport protein
MDRRFVLIASLSLLLGTAPVTSRAAESTATQAPADSLQTAAVEKKAAADGSRERPYRLKDRITVVGSPNRARGIPGAVNRISREELSAQNQAYDDVHRVLLRIPGVAVMEEDGYGLRPNIGLRAVGSDRSANITLMEDGVLAAPAPYSAPAAYYFPVTGRMEGVEVRKGSSQVKYGPRSNGGALNLLSTSIPDERRAFARASGGSNDSRKLHALYGDNWKNLSWLLETYQSRSDGFKKLDTGGDTGFDLQDYVAKVRVASSPEATRYQELTFKLGYRDETSDETYLGLTDEDFADDPLRRYAASREDVMTNEHWQGLLRHVIALSATVDVTTSLYRNDFDRNWYKLDRVSGVSLGDVLEDPSGHATEYAYLTGDSTSPDGALAVKANNRSYYSQGVESIVGINFDGLGFAHDLEVGLRYHEDEEDRLQHTDGYRMETGGAMVRTSQGVPGGSGGGDNRVGSARAVAGFAQSQLTRGNWTVVPGVRTEWIETTQTQYAGSDPHRAIAPTETKNTTTVVVPGIGAVYRANDWLDLIGGVHRGFAPPGPGANDGTKPEDSVNYEAGVRARNRNTELSVIGYYNDYENLLGRDTLSSGGSGSGDLYNAGGVQAYGLEASAKYTVWRGSIGIPLRAAYTYAHAEFQSSFQSTYEPWGTVTEGDELPYLPAHVFSGSAGLRTSRSGLDVFANYMTEMRTVAGQGTILHTESTDARLIVDVTGEYEVVSGARVFAAVENIADETYIASRLPSGVRPGLPRTFMAGLKFEL